MVRKRHKKRAWNSSNPLYRYQMRLKSKAKPKRSKKGGFTMARRRSHRTSRKGGLGLNRGIMGGLYHPTGMINQALVGIGTATAINSVIGEKIPFQSELVGFATGGVVGAGAVLLLKNAPKLLGGTNATAQGAVYY